MMEKHFDKDSISKWTFDKFVKVYANQTAFFVRHGISMKDCFLELGGVIEKPKFKKVKKSDD